MEEEPDLFLSSAFELDACEAEQDVNIGPLSLAGGVYTHKGASYSVDVQDQPEKGLSFQIWPSSLTLIQYSNLQPGFWQGKHVIELGCGCGLVGLCLAAHGANVLLTDLPEPLDLIRQNIGLNQQAIDEAGGTATAWELTWGVTQILQLPEQWRAPDVVLAADVVYRQELFQPLLCCLDMLDILITKQSTAAVDAPGKQFQNMQDGLRCAAGPNTVVLLAHVRRWKNDKRFFKALAKMFTVTDTTSSIDSKASLVTSNTKGALRLFALRRDERIQKR